MKAWRYFKNTVKVIISVIMGLLCGALFALLGCLLACLLAHALLGFELANSTAMLVIYALIALPLFAAGFLIGIGIFFINSPEGGYYNTRGCGDCACARARNTDRLLSTAIIVACLDD